MVVQVLQFDLTPCGSLEDARLAKCMVSLVILVIFRVKVIVIAIVIKAIVTVIERESDKLLLGWQRRLYQTFPSSQLRPSGCDKGHTSSRHSQKRMFKALTSLKTSNLAHDIFLLRMQPC